MMAPVPSDFPMTHDYRPTDRSPTLRIGDVEFIWARSSREFLFSNSILVHGDRSVIVDPSASFTAIEGVAASREVKTVLNTHYHGDHRSLNHLFHDAVFASHELDAPAIADHREYARMSDADPDSYYARWTLDVFKKYRVVECPVALKLKDGDILDTGAERIRVLHAPGHTPGHLALFFELSDILYTSDVDLTPYGPWYANVVSDLGAFRGTVQKLGAFACSRYVTSHGERVYDRDVFREKIIRYAAHFDDRETRILEALKGEALDMAALCSRGIVYKVASLGDPLKAYFQFRMVEKHVADLLDRGLIARDGERLVFTG